MRASSSASVGSNDGGCGALSDMVFACPPVSSHATRKHTCVACSGAQLRSPLAHCLRASRQNSRVRVLHERPARQHLRGMCGQRTGVVGTQQERVPVAVQGSVPSRVLAAGSRCMQNCHVAQTRRSCSRVLGSLSLCKSDQLGAARWTSFGTCAVRWCSRPSRRWVPTPGSATSAALRRASPRAPTGELDLPAALASTLQAPRGAQWVGVSCYLEPTVQGKTDWRCSCVPDGLGGRDTGRRV